MDTLVNTAKIGLEAQIRQSKASGSQDNGGLMETIGQLQMSVTELKDNTALKIYEEQQQRQNDLSEVTKQTDQKVEVIKSTFVNRLNLVEKQA